MKQERKQQHSLELSTAPKNYNGSANKWFTTAKVSLDQLPKYLTEHNYSAIQWRDGSRKESNFIKAVAFVGDYDEGKTIQEVHDNLSGQGLNHLIIPSKSHTPEHHKFHVVIPFEQPVYSSGGYKKIAEHIVKEILTGSDPSVTDAARYIYGSKDDADATTCWDGHDLNIAELAELWNQGTEIIDKDGNLIKTTEVVDSTPIYCPFHEDSNPSAFINYSTSSENWFIHCSTCGQTFWMEKEKSNLEIACKPYWSYGTDIFDFGIQGDEFFFEKVGEKKFHVLTKSDADSELKKVTYNYLVSNKHIRHITRIDYLGDINATESYFDVNLKHGLVEVHHAAIPAILQDNTFVDAYLEDRFGKYTDYIKEWWAMFCYTNHFKLPTIILKGRRGNGKSTFAEITGEIFRPLTFEWNGSEDSFTYEVEKKLLLVEENENSAQHQYKTLKKYTGQKYATVKKKFKDPYVVRNNMSIILLANDALPLFVSRDELPANENNNQFFVYEFPDITGPLDVDIQTKLEERLGHYIRTELKTVYDNINSAGCRYGIKVPVTDEEKALFRDSISNLESDADKYIQKLILYYGGNRQNTYSEFIDQGYLPTQFFRDFDVSNTHVNSIIKNLKRRGYVTGDAERIQVSGNRQFCYKMTVKLINEIESSDFEDKSGGRATEVAGTK